MSAALPLDDVDALRRIRTRRVERAMHLFAGACAAVDTANAVVAQRLEQVEAIRRALHRLRDAIGSALATELPRWASLIFARQQRLADQLERAEDKLLTARHKLDEARHAWQRARVDLARAQRRDQAAADLARRARRQLAVELERRLELDAETVYGVARSAR